MLYLSSIIKLLLVAAPVFAAPSAPDAAGKYIVTLKSHVDVSKHLSGVSFSRVTHRYSVINGFGGDFSESEIQQLKSHQDVQNIERDLGVSAFWTNKQQADATWGLHSLNKLETLQSGPIDKNPAHTNFTFKYIDDRNVDIDTYVLDTGIYTAHPEFEGRATWGKTFGGYSDEDVAGHGTHVAGIIGSKTYGVAKGVNLVAVKVLNDEGHGNVADLISGIQYVKDAAAAALPNGRRAVALIASGGPVNQALDDAVKSLIASNVTVVVAAGNDAKDASSSSPGRVAEAVTVGAFDINYEVASFSNYGPSVDFWGAGVDVISLWNDGKTKSVSGTSQAAAFAAGVAAYELGRSFAVPSGITLRLGANVQAHVPSKAGFTDHNGVVSNGVYY